ncbi:response regulator [Yangia sp. PrR002]|nr:response regulator [Salipiger sp. PrR002]NDW55466.1 response regulator [Salipiger sp. PrR004]
MSGETTPAKGPAEGPGKGKVMICEDEVIVAMDLQMLLEDFGYEVIGPFPSVAQGFAAIEGLRPDVALLDVRLKDGEVYPLADRLQELGVGLVFQSGHVNEEEIAARYPQARCSLKPINPAGLQMALTKAAMTGTTCGATG